MPNKTTSPGGMTAAAKQAKAMRLRASGMSFENIARELGYRSHSGAHKAVTTGLQKTLKEPAEELRTLEAERLDRMLEAMWPRATGDSKEATWYVDRVLAIMDRRAKLLGLDAQASGDNSIGQFADTFRLGAETMRELHLEQKTEVR